MMQCPCSSDYLILPILPDEGLEDNTIESSQIKSLSHQIVTIKKMGSIKERALEWTPTHSVFLVGKKSTFLQ